jgi:VWFA-related protein
MAHLSFKLIPALVCAISLIPPSTAQTSTAQSQAQPAQSQPAAVHVSPYQANPPSFVLRTYTRMVNLEVVVKDSKGNHIQGLKPEDFQIFEQTPERSKDKHEQKIAEFREVHMADLAAPASIEAQTPPGVYTNALAKQKDPVPPTILLVDGLNTDVQYQAQVHIQMLKMLRQLPTNVPVAVFLLGDRLTLLQSFTSDPKLLQAALNKAYSAAGVGLATMDPRDDPNSPSAASGMASVAGDSIGPGNNASGSTAGESGVEGPGADFAAVVGNIASFDQRIFAATMDERVFRTINALTSLGHNVAGYPGRKNLLWMSTSFPINLYSIMALGGTDDSFAEFNNYERGPLQHLEAVLSDAKVAVYPVNLAGVQTWQAYQAGARPPDVTPAGLAGNTTRDVMMQNASVDTMHDIANETGGIVCTGDNDLGDCVHKAMDDSSDFYEIAYYPDSGDWNGDFRKIIVKSGQKGAHLAYRQGYFAFPEGSADPKAEEAKMQGECDDYLDATSVSFEAKNLPSDTEGQLKFSLLIDASALTIPPLPDGNHQLKLDIAVCTYNAKDWPLKLMNYPVNLALDEKKFETLTTTGKLADTISIPAPEPAAIRLLVKDVSTGKLGSVYIKTGDLVAQVPKQSEAKEDPNAVVQQ